jgi:molybdopterin-biosynthesis enzyme MoeA-like protein
MKATIVTIGDEILIGQIVDTNSAFIAKSLDKSESKSREMISISDDKQHILDTFCFKHGRFSDYYRRSGAYKMMLLKRPL